ncbi:hypothetical protein AQJ43_30140 [Streptomyces avermitilis]|uniref:Uncharacterized protein n=1 Tax=Streptomyces avermitilis TaxID=33903 RepID=A0A4D4N8U2_STRAX|nr:hypothetical protein [Streptomyces avermitilis]KUN50979.1 hypothetical protein AQJ43_30140 [Streptomyces avermitilis]BBJ47960.1 hypothetical protein SAVMC3_05890 [Streptomyces avermitilis]GDY69676.1 hypothetical protein SAV14893_090690 [Streptomyces avermitilis]GDY79929.1 hypothetical protein SAV31267_094140 [Streptomyces avermitilis]
MVGEIAATPTGEALELVLHLGESLRGVRVESSDATARPDGLDFLAELPARGEWHTTALVRPSVEGEEAGGLFHPGAEPGESGPARRLCAWRESAPRITDIEDPEVHRTLRRSLEDLGAPAHLRPAAPRTHGGRRRCPLVHGPVRPRLAAVLVHGTAAGPCTPR